jgi:hypothetical protein
VNLPTPEDVYRDRQGKPLAKGQSRLEKKVAEKKRAVIDALKFRDQVWKRDDSKCRWCGRTVRRVLMRIPSRGEVHHIHGRVGDLEFETKCAILACLICHEKLTGKVNERWKVVSTHFWVRNNEALIDARYPVRFERVA